MRKASILLLASLLSLSASQLRADIAAIHASALPQETAVLAALDDARELEPYSRSWTMNWDYPVAKDEVAARLGKDLGFLTLAAKNHPDNAELLLLTGLVARYAYNVDVDGSYDAAMSALDQAQKLAPTDFRALWFRATLQCQTRELKAGAEGFLAIEGSHAWNSFPIAFWEDYTNCATIANLPEHTLRAVGHLEELHAGEASDFATAVNIARNRLVPFDPKKAYEPKEVWSAENAGDASVFTSTLCGVQVRAHGDWEIHNLELNNGSCLANFGTGPYKGTAHSLHPSVMLLVQRPKEGETLEDYSRKFQSDGSFEPDPALHCPVAHCIALKGVQPNMYKKDGDGHGRLVIFERDEPEFPGLIFESPLELPKGDGSAGAKYYRPGQIQQRIPGKLYYLVLLDTAASIEEPAVKDFEFFLENLTVE
ncbi:MAG: hypothetical protein ABSF23_02825 [Terracidiphilus sp.]|jgi:hypothetical protein